MPSSDIVPPVLLRLREVDIIRCCGLTIAASGREYLRIHPPREATRQQHTLCGIFDRMTGAAVHDSEAHAGTRSTGGETPDTGGTFIITSAQPERDGRIIWTCTCGKASATTPCIHVAALLYYWVQTPHHFRSTADQERSPVLATEETEWTLPARLPMALEQRSLTELRAIARTYGFTVPANSDRTTVVQQISAALGDPSSIQQALQNLSASAQRLWQAMALLGGALTDQELRCLFERLNLGRPAQLHPALEELRQRALLLRIEAAGAGIGWRIPQEALDAIHIPLPLPEYPDAAERHRDQIHSSRPFTVLAGLALLARVLPESTVPAEAGSHTQPAPFTQHTMPAGIPLHPESSSAHTPMDERLAAILGESLAFTRFTRRLLSIVMRQPDSPDQTPWDRIYPLLFTEDRAAVSRDLFSLWLHADNYDELLDLRDYGVELRYNPAHPHRDPSELSRATREARCLIINLLRHATPGHWYSFTAFVHLVHQLAPGFLRGRQETFTHPQWWPARATDQRPLRANVLEEWQQVEGRFLAMLFRRALFWWGAVELILAEKKLSAFRLTDFGRYLLGSATAPIAGQPAARPANLTLDTNGDLQVDPVAEVPLLRALDACCEPVTARDGHLIYRLSPSRLAAILQTGQQIDTLLTTLEHYTAAPLPEAWKTALRARAARAGYTRFYLDVPVLEAMDSVAMCELNNTIDLQPLLLRTISPTSALLNGDELPKLFEALTQLGQKVAESPT